MNIFELIGDFVTNPASAWDKFLHGEQTEVNKQEAQNEREFSEREAEKARAFEAQQTDIYNEQQLNLANLTNQSNLNIARETNASNRAIAAAANQLNKDIANQNLAFQRENLDYQKSLQQQIFEREDTAYQRTASDMAKAGLNPLTMNGTNGSGEAIATTAMNSEQSALMSTDIGSNNVMPGLKKNEGAQFMAKYSKFQALSSGLSEVINTITGVSKSMDQLMSGFAQRDSLQTQIDSNKLDNDIKLFNLGYSPDRFKSLKFYAPIDPEGRIPSPLEFDGNFSNNKDYYNPLIRKQMENITSGRQFQNDIKYNLFNNSTEWERNLTSFEKALDTKRFNKFAAEIGDAAIDVLGSFEKIFNKSK